MACRLEAEKEEATALAQADAQSRVQQEVSRVLAAERSLTQDSLQAAVLRERASADDEKLRAQRYVSPRRSTSPSACPNPSPRETDLD